MSNYTSGSLNQLGNALEKEGWTVADVTKLKQSKELNKIKDFLYGKDLIAFIDTDAQPFIRRGMEVVSHTGSGMLRWPLNKLQLFLCKEQEKNYQEGNELRKVIESLKGKKVLNANVLDYLLVHQELIPDNWKDKAVYFWGTIYRDSGGEFCVRCLYRRDYRWRSGSRCLYENFHSSNPAALAS